MKDFWNERYHSDEYVYGKAPNQFFKKNLSNLKAGKILLPCEGEGRNAVYAATQNWQVTAFDQSEAGKKKAEQLSEKNNVAIDYQIADAESFNYGENKYDCIALIYAHFKPELRKKVHQACVKALKVGGQLLIEGFRKEQLAMNSGGPKDESMLYTKENMRKDFSGLRVDQLKATTFSLNEGQYHQGDAAVIQYIGVKQPH